MNDNTLHGRLTASGNLTGTVNTIVYAHNYNDLSNKPSINSITLQGNKTASELGLATPSDIPVTSVNEQTGDVELTGDNIPYDTLTSVNAKINDLESQIVGAGVQSVNGMTGNVTLTGANINYSVGVSLNSRIDAVEGEIPVINYPVTSVNGKTGAVSLAGSDIEYSAGVSLTDQIDNISGEISDLTGADIPMTALDSTKVATAIGSLSSLTTTNKDSLVDAVNEVNGAKVDNTVSTVYINAVTNVSQTLGSYTRKLGKLVNLCHNFKITTAAASGTTIATLQSSANYPSANSNAFCLYGSNGTTWLVSIDTSGNIKANNNMPVGEYVLFGYYPTA